MKCQDVLKICLQFLLIIALLILTYFRLDKLYQEETSLSYSTVSSGLYLPSLTLCFRSYNDEKVQPKMDSTVTFKDFMENSRSVKDILMQAYFELYGPNDKNRWKYDLIKKEEDDLIQESFYLAALGESYYGVNRCITINAPSNKSVHFKDAYVSIKETISLQCK